MCCELSYTKALKGHGKQKQLCNSFSRSCKSLTRLTQLVLSDCNLFYRFPIDISLRLQFVTSIITIRLCESRILIAIRENEWQFEGMRSRVNRGRELLIHPRERISQFHCAIYFCFILFKFLQADQYHV